MGFSTRVPAVQDLHNTSTREAGRPTDGRVKNA